MYKIICCGNGYMIVQEVGDEHVLVQRCNTHAEALSVRQELLGQQPEETYDNFIDFYKAGEP